MYVGVDIPTITSHVSGDVDHVYEDAHHCSSMCSAASTVASAMSSVEVSTSFPATTSDTSFEFETMRVFQMREEYPALSRSVSSRAQHTNNNVQKRQLFHPYQRILEVIATTQREGPSTTLNSLPNDSAKDKAKQIRGELEEFSLGAGNPWSRI